MLLILDKVLKSEKIGSVGLKATLIFHEFKVALNL